ncbi:hypothetical protein [Pseudomonas brassicacearum]|uniref:hypothetical protein n=1 Tax=Pseudomonas brassicacearum TaxID=930166 RepID=UPI003CE7A69B
MNTKPQAADYKEIADEAVFQLECGNEFGNWMFSLMTAIRDDHKHSGGLNAAGLAALGVYLSESHLEVSEQTLEVLNANLSSLGGAA